jgi:DNA modification methylase
MRRPDCRERDRRVTVFFADPDTTLHMGDAHGVLETLPDESVHAAVTSPPFYGLRDYGVDGQIGIEETPAEWCASLVAVFRELRRVLRSDGVFWLEIGDSYATSGGQGASTRSAAAARAYLSPASSASTASASSSVRRTAA